MKPQIIHAILSDRSIYNKIRSKIKKKGEDKHFIKVLEYIDQYYAADPNATKVDDALLLEHIAAVTASASQQNMFREMIESARAIETSIANVELFVNDVERYELGIALATSIASGKIDEDLLNKYSNAVKLVKSGGVSIMKPSVGIDVQDLVNDLLDPKGGYILYPKSLNSRLAEEGREDLARVSGGDVVFVYARPECGKTALGITMAAGMLMQGARTAYFGNEDRERRMKMRILSALTGLPKYAILDDPDAADAIARERGVDNLHFVPMAPGNMKLVHDYVRDNGIQVYVLDQVRNMEIDGEASKVERLEQLMMQNREISKSENCISIALTQAHDSASGKAVLSQSDVDSSKTGMMGAVDVAIGMGMTPEMEDTGERVLTLTKNKLGARHESFPVKLIQSLSRVNSYESAQNVNGM